MSKELKPCGHCGGEAFVAPSGSCGGIARCGECGARTVSDYSQDQAVELWNTRHIPEGYAMVRVDDINTACETLKTIAFRAKAPNLLTPEVVMWAESFRRHIRKVAK